MHYFSPHNSNKKLFKLPFSTKKPSAMHHIFTPKHLEQISTKFLKGQDFYDNKYV